MHVREGHRRDFAAYLRWRDESNVFCPTVVTPLPRGDCDTVRCFAEIESCGRPTAHPREPDDLRKALEGKAALNLDIKQWAGQVADAGLIGQGPALASLEELASDPELSWLPAWVWKAVWEQAGRCRNWLAWDKAAGLLGRVGKVHPGTSQHEVWP